jgi:cell division cycle protein 20 (cofactor of APC complex)
MTDASACSNRRMRDACELDDLLRLDSTPKRCNPTAPRTTPSSRGGPLRPSKIDAAGDKPAACGDRFIPNRGAFDMAVSQFEIARRVDAENSNLDHNASPAKEEYKRELASTLYQGGSLNNKVLAFKSKAPKPAEGHQSSLRVLYSQNKDAMVMPKRYARNIPQGPERILDAPDLIDDYYLNLLDWNSANVVAIALGDSVYLWSAADGSITQLMQSPADGSHVTSVAWIQEGSHLAIGTSKATTQLWDTTKHKKIREMDGHQARVGSLAWNAHVLTSGGRDGAIVHHDVRVQSHVSATLTGHTQEVCGLKWSTHGTQLASGANDNLLNIWDDRMTLAPTFSLTNHTAAVKALAWAPWQKHLLASGGGTADRMIRFWNTSTGQCLNAVDTHSQVCSLQWSKHDKELVSSHGFSHNQLIVWKYPSMVKVAELTGHTARVLHMAQSPDGTTIASAGADETLRFWKILASADHRREGGGAASSDGLMKMKAIR